MKKLIKKYYLLFLSLTFSILLIGAAAFPLITKAQAPGSAGAKTAAACIGEALAEYMNEVVSQKSQFSNIKLLSPAFNLTHQDSPDLFQAMVENDAQFGLLDGFAGNTYSNIEPSGRTAMQWYAPWKTRFAPYGKKTYFTEFGDFSLEGTTLDNRASKIAVMQAEYRIASGDGSVAAINYFNPFGNIGDIGNPDLNFVKHWMSDAELSNIISGGDASKSGANSAIPIGTGALSSKLNSLGMKWQVEIVYSPNDAAATAQAVNAALANGVTPIIRLCVGLSCEFKDPASLVGFLKSLSKQVSTAYVIVGPNEPISEPWIAPECGTIPEEDVPPWKPEKVPCDETRDPEFHSLRPYPASPCSDEIVEKEQTILCGNDLLLVQDYTVTQDQAKDNCRPGDVGEICSYKVSTTTNVALEFGLSELPIVGNTELVPNAVRRTSLLDFATRMSEYVSWYAQGVINRAEEKFFQLQDITEKLAFAGPIRKLHPQVRQNIDRAILSSGLVIGGTTPLHRHDQITVCADGSPAPCYATNATPRRLSEVVATPPVNNPLFPYLQFTRTEDSAGKVRADIDKEIKPTGELPISPPPTNMRIFNITFAPDDEIDGQRLFFPHMQEITTLGRLLQSQFVPGEFKNDFADKGAPAFDLEKFLKENQTCELKDTRTNPGDKLYGDIETEIDPNNPPINGSLSFDVEFDCEFEEAVPDPVCLAVCDPLVSNCSEECTPTPKCTVSAAVPLDIFTSTPKAEEVWNRYVAGSWSIFKRFFPQAGEGTPIGKEILDIPAETRAVYTSENQETTLYGGAFSPSEKVLAGGPFGLPGASAKIFFPHLGSVYDYFLKGIQTALRPKADLIDSGEAIISSEINCIEVPDSDVPDKYLGFFKSRFIDLADRWVKGEPKTNKARECYNDVVVRAIGAGVNPAFALTIWLNESDASNYAASDQQWQDFGINILSLAQNFDAQITRFLSITGSPTIYESSYPECYSNDRSKMENFMYIYHLGPNKCIEALGDPIHSFYYRSIFGTLAGNTDPGPWELVAPGCPILASPTDKSCP